VIGRPFVPRYGVWRPGTWWIALLALLVCGLALAASSLAPRAASVPQEVAEAADAAEQTMGAAERIVREAKTAAGVEDDPGAPRDPSGLVGAEWTPLVTTLGSAEAKRIATDPAWARVLTVRLHQAGIRRGDVIAAGFSGSFPGLNLAVIATAQAIGAELAAVSSVTASTWGANQPGFTWPEIEARLVRAGAVRRATIGVALGGAGDRGEDLEPEGRAEAERILDAAATALGVPAIRPRSFYDAVETRLALYDRARAGRRIALYVNVGGNEASLGRSAVILRFRSGFLPAVPFDFSRERGVVARMAERGVPVLSLLNIRELAGRWEIGYRVRP
jgi:poly-gamma-glutamate system protein